MSEIAIHRDQRGVAVRIGVSDTILMCAANAQFTRAVHGPDLRKFLRQAINDFARAIGRAVVAKKNVGSELERHQFTAKTLRVIGFVIGRNENEELRGCHVP